MTHLQAFLPVLDIIGGDDAKSNEQSMEIISKKLRLDSVDFCLEESTPWNSIDINF